MVIGIGGLLFKRSSIEVRDVEYLNQVIDDSTIPNRGLDTTTFESKVEKEEVVEIKEEIVLNVEQSICPRQLFDSKDWGIHLKEIELNGGELESVSGSGKTAQKPNHSYAVLIRKALEESANRQLSLSDIYKWIKENYSYYKTADPAWQNSIRHNLSLNKMFQKVKRPSTDPGKGGFWRINELHEPVKPRVRKDKENI